MQEKVKTKVHLAVAFDQGYLLPFYALAASIFHNNKSVSFSFHCIAQDIPADDEKEIAKYIELNNSDITFYSVDEKLISKFVVRNHWNSSVYYRIFFPLVIKPSVDRLLYLDTDTLVVNSLHELYRIDLQGFPIAAVRDLYVAGEAYSPLHLHNDYFNSGMLLIDVAKWNSLRISEETLDFLHRHPQKIFYVDQDALNATLHERCLLISEKFNFTLTHLGVDVPKKAALERLNELVVIHFTLSRPWHLLCRNPYRSLYKYYLRRSPKRKAKVITDFSLSKLPAYLRIRVNEFYMNSSRLRRLVRFVRHNVLNSYYNLLNHVRADGRARH